MKNTLIILVWIFGTLAVHAQSTHFTISGTIEFEKKVNTYALLKKRITPKNESYMQQFYDNYRKTQPQFKVLKSVLTFSKNKTLFKPAEDDAPMASRYVAKDLYTDQYNNTFTDLLTGTSITEKRVFEETFLVKDSTRKINWKITDETRMIAGFVCRRANAIIMDSIYVVAFYSGEIPVPGGPESFTGLPGMILGLALPHENVSWFATKVTDMQVSPGTIIAPTKGKPINNKQLKERIGEFTKDMGSDGDNYLKAALL